MTFVYVVIPFGERENAEAVLSSLPYRGRLIESQTLDLAYLDAIEADLAEEARA